MSKHIKREIVFEGLALFSIFFLYAAICTANQVDNKPAPAAASKLDSDTNTEVVSDSKPVGKENPFEVVNFTKPVSEDVIQSIKGTGITKAQLQEAIRAALASSGKGSDTAVPAQPVKVIPERHIKSVMLKFLRASNVLSVVKGMLSAYGTASVDEDTNTLIICDSKESLDKVVDQIIKADRTPRQVLVEVVILDVQLSDDTELGVNWENLFNGNGSVSYTQQLNDIANGGSLTLIRGRVETTIKALQKQRNTEILASPRVLVLSGQEARLETIEEIPYTQKTQSTEGGGGTSAIASTSFKNAGITLTVKPTITDDGRIMIKAEPSQSINTGVAGIGQEDVPIVDRRSVTTTLLMDEGEIAVIGGLRSKDVRITQDKIPLLGDIPIIGGFFSNDKEQVENSELLILISPHIYTGRRDLNESQEALWDEVQNLEPVRLHKTIRPAQETVKKLIPQNKTGEK